MIRLVTEQDRARVLSLCRKDAWDGTELLAAYSARCADKGGVDWRRCDLWIGESETQKKNIQYLLCRVGENYRLVGAPRSPTRWEELHAFLQLQPAGLRGRKWWTNIAGGSLLRGRSGRGAAQGCSAGASPTTSPAAW